MIILTDPVQLDRVSDPEIRALIAQRIDEISMDGYRLDELGMFVLVEPGDSITDLEKISGVTITASGLTAAAYGEPGFTPCYEYLEGHKDLCFEMVFIRGDGFGISIIVPVADGIDAELTRFCAHYAVLQKPLIPDNTEAAYAPGV